MTCQGCNKGKKLFLDDAARLEALRQWKEDHPDYKSNEVIILHNHANDRRNKGST
jgi:hypothetical protein